MRKAVPPLPNTPSWCGAQKEKHRDNFTFTIIVRRVKFYTKVAHRLSCDFRSKHSFCVLIINTETVDNFETAEKFNNPYLW
jgi:hypothetical protein